VTVKRLVPALAGPLLCLALAGFSGQDMSPRQILDRSVAAHGGARLTAWNTLTVQGTVDMFDGIAFRAAYRVFAKAPGKLRVEKDMTVTRGGRYFYEYFLNDGRAWSRRNLVVLPGNAEEMNRWLNQCYGIAWYAAKAETLSRLEDASVEWKEKADLQSTQYRTVATRPAYVISASIGKNTASLYIDKENFHFLQEISGRTRRVYWDFRKFGAVTMPARILEAVSGSQGEQLTPYSIQRVRFNAPIEDWLFTEDMPAAGAAKK
jgi:hypothetical protein